MKFTQPFYPFVGNLYYSSHRGAKALQRCSVKPQYHKD